jgi:hypothetical protein
LRRPPIKLAGVGMVDTRSPAGNVRWKMGLPMIFLML